MADGHPELNCVDMSRWGGEFTLAEADAMRALGIHTNIPGSGPGGYGQWTRQQAGMTIEAGLRLEGYAFVEWGDCSRERARWWAEQCAASFGPHVDDVLRFWPDFEETPVPAPLERAWDYIDYFLEAVDEIFPEGGFYGARWFHLGHLGNPTRWRDRQLWNAWYDGDPDIDGLPYGGWTRDHVAIEQYQGTTLIAGHSVDLNHMYIAPRGVREDEMTDDERALLLYLASLLAGDPSGREFPSVGDALNVLQHLENPGDVRLLEGLRVTQTRLGQLEGRVAELAAGDTAAARDALRAALSAALEVLE